MAILDDALRRRLARFRMCPISPRCSLPRRCWPRERTRSGPSRWRARRLGRDASGSPHRAATCGRGHPRQQRCQLRCDAYVKPSFYAPREIAAPWGTRGSRPLEPEVARCGPTALARRARGRRAGHRGGRRSRRRHVLRRPETADTELLRGDVAAATARRAPLTPPCDPPAPRPMDACTCDRPFVCVDVFGGCLEERRRRPVVGPPGDRLRVAGGVTVRTPSTATPPPVIAAAEAAAAAILPAVTVSTSAWARRNEFAARSCRCVVIVS
jgi:hypothetical protein